MPSMCKRHVALLNKLRQRLNNFQRELQAPGLWEELTEPPPAVIEGLPEAVRNMIDEVLKLGRLPKQNKRASNARLVRLPFRHNALPLEPTATHKMNGLAVLLSLLLNTVLARTPLRQMPTPPC